MAKELYGLNKKKEKIIKNLPPMTDLMRGTFIKWYGECKNPRCKCHKDRRYRHGPYYRVSYSKGRITHHVYVPLKDEKRIKAWVENYQKVWNAIEEISAINISVIRLKK